MERNSNAVFSSNVQPYPLYSEKPYMTFHQANNPALVSSFGAQPQYFKSNAPISTNKIPQVVPVQNYRVSATSPVRLSQAILQPQVLGSQAGAYYANPQNYAQINYGGDPNVVGVAMPQVNQNVVHRKMMPVIQYVPVDEFQNVPNVSPRPSMNYNLNSGMYIQPAPVTQQRVIIDQPEIYDKREIRYTPPPAKVAAPPPKPVVIQQPKYEETYRDPMVQTALKSFDAASVRSSRVIPPPVSNEKKTPCATWILALLGLLGLIGLILALVLSQNSKSSTSVQNTSPTVTDPQKVNAAAPVTQQPISVAPSKDLSNAEVKGQTAVTSPTTVAATTTEKTNTPATSTTIPTDISLTQPAPASSSPNTALSGVQPQTVAPTYISAGSTQTTTSTTSTATTPTLQPQPTTVQPNTVQPTTVPAIPVQSNTAPSTTQSATVQPATIPSTAVPTKTDWISADPAAKTTTSTSPAPSTATPTAPASAPQSISASPVSSNTQANSIPASPTASTSTTTTTTTTKTSTNAPAHFLTLRHHL